MGGALAVALVLASPVEVFEEWALTANAPPAEVVTARALYRRRDGDAALLPAAMQGAHRPEAYALGHDTALPVTRGPRGWQCALPPGDRDAVRLVARVARAAPAPRLFTMSWPAAPATAVPTRRVAVVGRDWLEGAHPGWTCPEEPADEVPCVSSERAPGPLVTRAPPLPSPRGMTPAALGLVALAFVAAAWSPRGRAERALAAAGGAAVALAVCLALVGARTASWAGSAAAVVPVGALVGAVAPRGRWGRVAGAAALVAVPLMAIAGAPATWVVAAALALGAAVVGGALAGE